MRPCVTSDECSPTDIEDDQPRQTNAKQGGEKSNREDEEGWTRIPIPQSDDSDSTEECLSKFVSPSLITNTLLYVRTSGPTWTKLHRSGPISNRFLLWEFMIPCAYLEQEQGTILRVVPYFIPVRRTARMTTVTKEKTSQVRRTRSTRKILGTTSKPSKATPLRKQRRTSTRISILLPLPPIPAFRFIKDPIFVSNTVNLVPNQLHDKKKLIQEFDNEPRNESNIDETNDNKTYKNLPLRILIHMDSRIPSNH